MACTLRFLPAQVWNAQPGNKKINLQGIAVGNGYADWQLDFNMNVPFARYVKQSGKAQRKKGG